MSLGDTRVIFSIEVTSTGLNQLLQNLDDIEKMPEPAATTAVKTDEVKTKIDEGFEKLSSSFRTIEARNASVFAKLTGDDASQFARAKAMVDMAVNSNPDNKFDVNQILNVPLSTGSVGEKIERMAKNAGMDNANAEDIIEAAMMDTIIRNAFKGLKDGKAKEEAPLRDMATFTKDPVKGMEFINRFIQKRQGGMEKLWEAYLENNPESFDLVVKKLALFEGKAGIDELMAAWPGTKKDKDYDKLKAALADPKIGGVGVSTGGDAQEILATFVATTGLPPSLLNADTAKNLQDAAKNSMKETHLGVYGKDYVMRARQMLPEGNFTQKGGFSYLTDPDAMISGDTITGILSNQKLLDDITQTSGHSSGSLTGQIMAVADLVKKDSEITPQLLNMLKKIYALMGDDTPQPILGGKS